MTNITRHFGRYFAKYVWAALLAGVLPSFAARASVDSAVSVDLSSASGVHWEFQPEGGSFTDITVPGGGWRAQGWNCDAGVYKTTIAIPRSATGKDIQLDFQAINFGADVYVGPDEDHLTRVVTHVDGWVPVRADITDNVTPGKAAIIEVDVRGRKKYMVNGKYIVPEGATWASDLEEGILRGVSLDILPLVHIDNVYVRPSVHPDALSATVTLTNSSAVPQVIHLVPYITDGKRTIVGAAHWRTVAGVLSPGESSAISLPTVPWTLGPSSYWWPNVPYTRNYSAKLYHLGVDITSDSGISEHFDQRFGFREFKAVGDHYYLNGVICNLRGDNLQEANFKTDAYGIRPGFGPPSPGNGGWPEAVDNLLRLNFNVMRIHQIPATPYMLDICDEKGLMLVDESPLRGSEGGEDFDDGKPSMLAMDRELVLRDRDHPSVVIWSAANEWSEPIPYEVPVILAVDSSRPIIADGAGASAPVIDTGHYLSGFNVLPKDGMKPRPDRPYSETEDIWPGDNTLQGFAWMGTGVRLRRLFGDSDLRNYTLNNAWPNFVPGESPANELLEVQIKGEPNATILPALTDPWSNPNIKLIQNCYNPVAVADIEFDKLNANSNSHGDWPTVIPTISAGEVITRTIAIFNDEFSDTSVKLTWEAREDSIGGPIIDSGTVNNSIPLGTFVEKTISFTSPSTVGRNVYLVLTTSKAGHVRCQENQIEFVTARQ